MGTNKLAQRTNPLGTSCMCRGPICMGTQCTEDECIGTPVYPAMRIRCMYKGPILCTEGQSYGDTACTKDLINLWGKGACTKYQPLHV